MLRFRSIENLRAYMVWWVVVGHALHLVGLTPRTAPDGASNIILRFLTRGSTAVDVFIIVSGFVIAHLILVKKEGYLSYILRRWFRIFPIFAICLILALSIRPLYLEAYTSYPWVHGVEMRLDRANLETSEHFVQHLLLHLSMLHGMISEETLKYSSSTFLAPGWSLSLEWQFYIVAPFMLMLLRRSVGVGFFVAATSLISWYIVSNLSNFHWKYPSFLPLSIQYFLIGISSRFLVAEVERKKHFFLWGIILLASILCSDWLAILIWGTTFVVILSEARLITLPKSIQAPTHAIFGSTHIGALGQWSYSTYLLHIPLFSIVLGGYSLLIGGNMQQNTAQYLVIFAMFATVPVSWISYKMIERPFSKAGSEISKAITRSRTEQSAGMS